MKVPFWVPFCFLGLLAGERGRDGLIPIATKHCAENDARYCRFSHCF
jgi:hypothetical protein